MTGRVVSMALFRQRTTTGADPDRVAVRAAVFILVPVATLLVVGLGAVLSAASPLSLSEGTDRLFYFKRQLIWAAIGVGALLVTARVHYSNYRRAALPILILAIAALVAVLAFGDVRGGARRWIAVGPFTVQPSEFAKFAVVVFLAAVLSRKEGLLGDLPHFFWPVASSLGVVGALIMLQPDLGTLVLIGAAALAVMVASTAPMTYILATGAFGGVVALALAAMEPYRWARVTAFLNPTADALDTGFQAVQSLVALGTGGWFGVGLGASRARWSFLPNAHTDFIFAIIGEEVGFAGAIVVIALFAAFAVAGTVVALRAPDSFGRLLGIGIVAWLSAQAIVNVGGVVAVLPITGVPLPFLSAGGSALVVDLAAVGVLVNLAQAGSRPR